MTETEAQHFIIIANCVANVALAFVAISGKALVLYEVWKALTLRLPSILLLCGLASPDLCVGLIAQTPFILRSFIGLYSQSESLKPEIIDAYITVGVSLCGASLYILAGISVERLTVIVKPSQYPSILTFSSHSYPCGHLCSLCIGSEHKVLWRTSSVPFYLHKHIHLLEHLHHMPRNHLQNHASSSTSDSLSDSSVWGYQCKD